MTTYTGSCLCGAVRFHVDGELVPPDACHCTICRKISGHYYAGTDIPRERATIEGSENVTWYRSSEKVRRGFCKVCGANLFFDPIFRDGSASRWARSTSPRTPNSRSTSSRRTRATTTRSAKMACRGMSSSR